MSRYVLTREQLDRLQDEVQQLARLNETKKERIKELQVRKIRLSNAGAEDSKTTSQRLENSNGSENTEMEGSDTASVKQLKMLLEQERKLREYSETFAKQAGIKWAEEAILRELTAELCELQKAEIEIDNKRIEELQEKLENLKKGETTQKNTQETTQKSTQETTQKNTQETTQTDKQEKENLSQCKQFNLITEQLRRQLSDLHDDITDNPVSTEVYEQLKEVEKWMKELDHLVKGINDIESLRTDLEYMKTEIESRRKSLLKHQK